MDPNVVAAIAMSNAATTTPYRSVELAQGWWESFLFGTSSAYLGVYVSGAHLMASIGDITGLRRVHVSSARGWLLWNFLGLTR